MSYLKTKIFVLFYFKMFYPTLKCLKPYPTITLVESMRKSFNLIRKIYNNKLEINRVLFFDFECMNK